MPRRPKIKITCIDRLENAPAIEATEWAIPGISTGTGGRYAPW